MRSIKIIAFAVAGFLCLWLVGYAGFVVSTQTVKPENPGAQTGAIIVLTGGNHRIHTGLDLLARGGAEHLFISGVNPNVTRWKIISLWNGELPLPECCIDLGTSATTTRENAHESKEWIEDKNVTTLRLVTSNYHIPRALLEFRHALPDIEIIANPVMIPDYTLNEKRFWVITFSEYNKVLYRLVALPFENETS